MTDFDKNIIVTPGLCGHFALGTLSETYLKDTVFERNVFTEQIAQNDKIQKCQMWHQNQKSYHN